MINLNNLSMGFSKRTLFNDVSLSIFPKERIGLTGPNGAGKTTLFHIIRGDMQPLAGNVQIQKNINVGYLPQESQFHSDKTVMEEMFEGDQRLQALLYERRELEENMKADTTRYGDVLEELEVLGIYELEHKAEKILSGLGFKETDFHRPIVELSGGWQMRTLLAKLLTYPYDLLLLDEPTNYLDLSATLWLKDYLNSYDGAFVLISHDRIFLNDVTNYTIILEGARMSKMKGNYDAYIQQKEMDLKSLEKKQKTIEKKRKQLETFTQRFHAQPNRASAVKNKRKMIDKLESIDLPQEHKSMKAFEFDNVPASGYMVVQARDVGKSYGDYVVHKALDLEITRGQKVCLVGPNGAGKSTLLKMLAGVLDADQGHIKYGHNVTSGYYSQTRLDVLHPEKNALEEVFASSPQGTQAVRARSLLGLFSFHGDDVFKSVQVLSGGEKSRLILAKLLINPPNLMFLDEPTTHLDIDGVKALTEAFKKYNETMCFISHDLYFIREIADHIIEITPGAVRQFSGGLDYYMEKTSGRTLTSGSSSQGAPAEKSKPKKADHKTASSKNHKTKTSESNKKNDSGRIEKITIQHKQAKKRISQIKNSLRKVEDQKKELDTQSYIKTRQLNEAYGKKSADVIKALGRNIKDIQSRLRELEREERLLNEEHDQITS